MEKHLFVIGNEKYRTTKGFTQVGLSAMAHRLWYFNQLQ
jgi:hypothetical protein